MSCSKPLPPFTFDVLCYLNRDQLERFSIVCRPLKNFINRYFRSKPYRIFDRLVIRGGSYALVHNNMQRHPNRDNYSAKKFVGIWSDLAYYSCAEMRPYLGPTVRMNWTSIHVAAMDVDSIYHPEDIKIMRSVAYLWRDGNIEFQNRYGNRLVADDFKQIFNTPTILSTTVLQCQQFYMLNAHFLFKDYKILYAVKVVKVDYYHGKTDPTYWQEFLEQPGVKPVVVLRRLHRESIISLLGRLSKAFSSAVSPNEFKIVFVHENESLTEFREINKTSGEILELKEGLPVEHQNKFRSCSTNAAPNFYGKSNVSRTCLKASYVDLSSIQSISDIDGYEIRYSRDNQWLVFQSSFLDWHYDYYNQIFAVNLNDAPSTVRGHRQIRCLSNGIGEYLHPDFYPDSKSLIFTSNFHNRSIWVKELKAKFKHDYKQNLYTDSPPLPPTIQTDYCSHSPYRVQCYAMYNAAWELSKGRSSVSYSWKDMSQKRKEMKTDAVWIRPLSLDMDIFRMDLEGNIQMQLTNETGFDGHGTISPDGRWIVYTSMSTGDPELWIMNAVNGSGKRQLLRRKGFEGSVSFSSDGKRIIFIGTSSPITHVQRQVYDKRLREHHYDSRNTSLYLMDIGSGNLTQIDIDTKSSRTETTSEKEKFDANELAHFSSSKFINDEKIMFHACYDVTHDYICVYRRLFICNANGTDLEEITIGAASDLPTVALNSAQTQIAFFSDLREHEKSTHRLRTLFIANWINNEQNINSVKQMSSRQRYTISFGGFYDNGLHFAKETFLNQVQQLTFGGTNLAPKFSADEKLIFFESVIKSMVLSHNSGKFIVSEPYPFGAGFGSTHSLGVVPVQISDPYYIYAYEHNFCAQQRYQICSQNKMDANKMFLNPSAELYKVNQFGQIIRPLTNNSVYDSDVAISPNGRWIVFSSMESGDPELWIFELVTLGEYYSSWTSDDDGLWKIKGVRRITHRLGYEFGASFSRDSQKIVFAASVPTDVGEIESYKKLLSENYVDLTIHTEIFFMQLTECQNWSEPKQITQLKAKTVPDAIKDFLIVTVLAHLFVIKEDGSDLQQITFNENGYDSFPALNSDGSLLLWSSNRNSSTDNENDVNIFVARMNV